MHRLTAVVGVLLLAVTLACETGKNSPTAPSATAATSASLAPTASDDPSSVGALADRVTLPVLWNVVNPSTGPGQRPIEVQTQVGDPPRTIDELLILTRAQLRLTPGVIQHQTVGMAFDDYDDGWASVVFVLAKGLIVDARVRESSSFTWHSRRDHARAWRYTEPISIPHSRSTSLAPKCGSRQMGGRSGCASGRG